MDYETPQLNVLTPAINAIQSTKSSPPKDDGSNKHEFGAAAYEDWEE